MDWLGSIERMLAMAAVAAGAYKAWQSVLRRRRRDEGPPLNGDVSIHAKLDSLTELTRQLNAGQGRLVRDFQRMDRRVLAIERALPGATDQGMSTSAGTD